MLKLRNSLPSIARGSFDAPFVAGQVLGYRRHWGEETTLVLLNFGGASAEVEVDGLAADVSLVPAYPAGTTPIRADASGKARIAMTAQSVRVWVVTRSP